jgi:hypothetical protein
MKFIGTVIDIGTGLTRSEGEELLAIPHTLAKLLSETRRNPP